MATIPQEASEDGRQCRAVFGFRPPDGVEKRGRPVATTPLAAYWASYQNTSPACPLSPDGVPRRGSRLAVTLYVTYQAGGKNEVLTRSR